MSSSKLGNPVAARSWSWWYGAALVFVLALAIRPESFWIDELSSAYVAGQSTWTGFNQALSILGSEAQMPFYMAWLWGWAHLFGVSEWGLRAANLPWAVVAVVAWLGLLRRGGVGGWAVWILLSPFLGYYMNEARPYVMTCATSLVALYAAERLCARELPQADRAASVLLLAGVGLCLGASLLNLMLLPSLLVYGVVRKGGQGGVRAVRDLARNQAGTWAGLLGVTACVAVYYAFTLAQGHGGYRAPFSLVNAAATVYEALGFGGLGVPRAFAHEMALGEVWPRYGLTLAAGIVAWVLVAWAVWLSRRSILQDPVCRAAIAGCMVGSLGLVAAAVVFRTALWGRHFMVVMPLFFWAVACGLEPCRRERPGLARVAGWVLVGVFAVSIVRQRALDDYRKDPLREALVELRAISRHRPDRPALALVYPLALWRYGASGDGIVEVSAWPEAKIKRWLAEHPQYWIMVNRPEKLDLSGLWMRQLKESHATVIWQRGNTRIYRVQP